MLFWEICGNFRVFIFVTASMTVRNCNTYQIQKQQRLNRSWKKQVVVRGINQSFVGLQNKLEVPTAIDERDRNILVPEQRDKILSNSGVFLGVKMNC